MPPKPKLKSVAYRYLQRRVKEYRDQGLLPQSTRLNVKASILRSLIDTAVTNSLGFNKKIKIKKKSASKPKIKEVFRKEKKSFRIIRYTSGANNPRELYRDIKAKFKQGDRNVRLFFRDRQTKQTSGRMITVDEKHLKSYKDFKDFITKAVSGQIPGSDPRDVQELELDPNAFEIASTVLVGYGVADQILFKCAGVRPNKNRCWKEVIERLGYEVPKGSNLSKIEDFIKFLEDHEIKYPIIENRVDLNAQIIEEIRAKTKPALIPKQRYCRNGSFIEKVPMWKLDAKKCKFSYFRRFEDSDMSKTIIFDPKNKHYDLLIGEPEFDNLWLNYGYFDLWRYKSGDEKAKRVSTAEDVANWSHGKSYADEELNKKRELELEYIFFDFETVTNYHWDSVMKPYSLSFLVLNQKDLERLNHLDELDDLEGIKKLTKGKLFNKIGFDCIDALRDYVIKYGDNKQYKFVSFNGSSFDNFILLDYLLKANGGDHFRITCGDRHRVFYNGSRLVDFRINAQHSMFDLALHLIGSLANNCESFKVKTVGKTKFNHDQIQQMYEDLGEKKFTDELSQDAELIEYNNRDVLSLAVLFNRYQSALSPMCKQWDINFLECRTVGSFIWKICEKHFEKKGIFFDKLDRKTYNDILKYKTAGRVEMFNGPLMILERIVSMDVCSLYPYILSIAPVYYGYGKVIKFDSIEQMPKDKLGFVYCDIDQSILDSKDLPLIVARKTEDGNDWDSKTASVLNDYLISTPMYNQLVKYGCKVKAKSGFYHSHKMKSCEMFSFLKDFAKLKNEQDKFKKLKDPKYNPALREVYKLLMNSVSGKVIEGLHLESVKMCNAQQYIKMLSDPKIEEVSAINIIGEEVFVTVKYTQESKMKKQRPIHLGVYCYDYGKIYMYDNCYAVLGKSRMLYTDTDAGKFRYRDFHLFKNHATKTTIPHWPEVEDDCPEYKTHKMYDPNSKIFGSFENELKDNNLFYVVQKKGWAVFKDEEYCKWGFKGVPKKSILIDIPDNYNELNAQQRAIYYRDLESKNLKHLKNVKEFFRRVYEEGKAYVVTQSFKKSVKNPKKATLDEVERFNTNNNTVQMRHLLKKITLNEAIRNPPTLADHRLD